MSTNSRSRVEAAVGYEASQSVFSPQFPVSVIPRLPQSALLNTIPVEVSLLGELQAYVESFVQLVNPSPRQKLQLAKNTSSLWINLRINAQRAAGMFIYNLKELRPVIDPNDKADMSILRKEFSKSYLDHMQTELLRLVNESKATHIPECEAIMRTALTDLCNVGGLLVQYNDTFPSIGPVTQELAAIPRLRGRATVTLTFERPLPNGVDIVPLGTVQLIVDGFNFPITGGNFIDLCKQGYYTNVRLAQDKFEHRGSSISRMIMSSPSTGYQDPDTERFRRIPLEVLREEENGARFTATGSARNSMVFTKAFPVYSFATEGAIGMLHDERDANSATSAFFFVPFNGTISPTECSQDPLISRLDSRYAIFAHVVEGGNLLYQLAVNDTLVSADVEQGVWDVIDIRPVLKNSRNSPEIIYRGDSI